MGWADGVAMCQHRRLPRCVQLDDVKQAAYIGLIKAARSFDPTRGASFKTFARYRIVGAIKDDLRLSDWATRTARRDGLVPHHVLFGDVVSSENDDSDYSWCDVEDRTPNLADSVIEDMDNKAEVAALLRGVPRKYREVIEMYHMRSMFMSEIGREVGLSESRVSQILSQWTNVIRDSGRRVA